MAKRAAPKPAEPEPTISNAYLMWIGSDSYPGIRDWTQEAREMGISKRLPNTDIGRALMRPGVAVFVAHDEGETDACGDCLGMVECPECRKRAVERSVLEQACDDVERRYGMAMDGAPAGDQRFVALRRTKIAALNVADAGCCVCHGAAKYHAGTGGNVMFEDGTQWDYRRFNYWLHQPARFSPDEVVVKNMCARCGGTGEIPDAKVFGVFVPERIEYILTPDATEDDEKLEAVREFIHITPDILVMESKRRCGKRSPGGVYAVTTTEGVPEAARKALDELVEKGLVEPDAADIHGSFIQFSRPISVMEKRFRGIKSIDLSIFGAALTGDAEDILEALAS